jgi:predicted RNase H-like HicB family nuclease
VLTSVKEGGFDVYSPDFDRNTQGEDMADAVGMAEDMISMMGVIYQDDGEAIPEPSKLEAVDVKDGQQKTLVSVDFEAYRKTNSLRPVKKTLTIPSWLNAKAEEEGVNFSETLKVALQERLGV